ncbi:uncharacterized protein LOC133185862 [Saccostrea echinata]|uniref:uncharacterized protein LOC133185862 n=1 Tax=Saccostrea echinata TaxID=191078 RepID=UPI002A835AD5|nr:uncharacterized protein LOC133185862 [Saccostrea echinata]XP_061177147.1 uncharacterized protein LOC133185862 [Saccostrea echinata]XP_061177155.1 uncharacterized protein LOC133185862 [Saccostrea echinata]
MSDSGDGRQSRDEEDEQQKMREAARRTLQRQKEVESQGLELHEVGVRLAENNQSNPLHDNTEQDEHLPTYDEAMRMRDQSNNDHRISSSEDDHHGISSSEDDHRISSRDGLDEAEHGPLQPPYDQYRPRSPGARRDLYAVPREDQDSASYAGPVPQKTPPASLSSSFLSLDEAPPPGPEVSSASVFRIEEGRNEDREEESQSRLQKFIHRRIENISFNQLCCAVILVTGIISAIVFLGVFPSSFVYLDYHKMALKYNKITGMVDRSTTYEFGCYILGPSVGFLEFDATAHTVSKTHGVFTLDKLPIDITYHVQYFIKKKELGALHREFGVGYDDVIRSVIESEMKNLAVPFSVDQFRLHRPVLEKYFHRKLKERLEGNCCPDCCPSTCENITLCSLCPSSSSCNKAFHINVEFFHFGKVDIPAVITERYLTRTLLKENADREVFIQEKMVETKKTLRETTKLRNTANEIQQAAVAESRKIGIVASVNREANLTDAYISALSSMFTRLKVTQEEHKLSIMMIRALEDVAVKGNLYRTYGYDNGTMSLYTKGMSRG